MAGTNIGGIWMSLGLNPDKNSFDEGQKLVGGMTDSFSKLIGMARNAAVVVAAQKAITGAVSQSGEELQKLHTAERLGVDATQLNVWKAAAKIAGANADSLVSSMSKIANIQARLRWDAAGLETYQKELARLKISYEEIKDLNADKALEYIFKKAETMKGEMTTAEISSALEDIAGSGAADLYIELQRQGKSFNQFFAGAASTQYQTPEGMNASADFAIEINTLGTTLTSIKNSLGDKIAEKLTGPLKTINSWFTDHKTDISNGINTISEKTGELVTKIGDWWDANGDDIKATLQLIGSGVITILGWLTSEKAKGVFGGIKEQWSVALDTTKEIAKSLWNGDGQVLQILQKGTEDMLKAAAHTIGIPVDDGIIRPDGTVTPIAPDDWVFAARDIGDMAKAFIPQSMTQVQAPSEYVINQTFNINGSNDIPQVLKQQAYRGTQEGLMAVLEQSSRRLELMSGTR